MSNRPAPRQSSLTGSSPVQPPSATQPPAGPDKPAVGSQRNESTPPKKAAPKAKGATTTASDTVRLGLYMTRGTFDSAKSAYLSDWQHVRQADTFNRWIGQVLDAHAARGANERAHLTGASEQDDSPGFSRSFTLPADTIERMRAAITDDQNAGRWPSDSAWCSDAIMAAVDAARERAGGTLPPAPARLPNRLR